MSVSKERKDIYRDMYKSLGEPCVGCKNDNGIGTCFCNKAKEIFCKKHEIIQASFGLRETDYVLGKRVAYEREINDSQASDADA